MIAEHSNRHCIEADASRRLPDDPQMLEAPAWDGRSMVPLRLRLLRQHTLLPAILKEVSPTRASRQNCCSPWPCSSSSPSPAMYWRSRNGPDRPPSTPVHRLCRHGGVFHCARLVPQFTSTVAPSSPFSDSVTSLPSLGRTRRHSCSLRGVPREHAHDRTRHRRRNRQTRGIRRGVPGATELQDALRPAMACWSWPASLPCWDSLSPDCCPNRRGRTLEDVADNRSDSAVTPAPVRVVATDDLTSRELKTA